MSHRRSNPFRLSGTAAVACALSLVAGCASSVQDDAGAIAPRDAAPSLAAALAKATLVDLTHTFDKDTLVWPSSDSFRLETVFDGTTTGGWHYAANNIHTTEHGGTHLDAPIHFAAAHDTTEAIALERLVGPALVVDVSDRASADADYLITVDDLRRWEAQHGPIERGSRVLLRTGWSSRWPNAERYLGTALRGEAGVAQLHFPGLHPDAATFLVGERGIAAVGIDTASLDRGQSATFEAHRILAAANVPGFENLTNLERLPARGALLFALPMKVGGGSGGPLRAVAVVP